jgi:hypothetical protein
VIPNFCEERVPRGQPDGSTQFQRKKKEFEMNYRKWSCDVAPVLEKKRNKLQKMEL